MNYASSYTTRGSKLHSETDITLDTLVESLEKCQAEDLYSTPPKDCESIRANLIGEDQSYERSNVCKNIVYSRVANFLEKFALYGFNCAIDEKTVVKDLDIQKKLNPILFHKFSNLLIDLSSDIHGFMIRLEEIMERYGNETVISLPPNTDDYLTIWLRYKSAIKMLSTCKNIKSSVPLWSEWKENPNMQVNTSNIEKWSIVDWLKYTNYKRPLSGRFAPAMSYHDERGKIHEFTYGLAQHCVKVTVKKPNWMASQKAIRILDAHDWYFVAVSDYHYDSIFVKFDRNTGYIPHELKQAIYQEAETMEPIVKNLNTLVETDSETDSMSDPEM